MTEQMYLQAFMGLEFWTTKRTAYILDEAVMNAYRCFDYAGKRVLDIGGFSGDTAVMFHHWGARRVTVVEGAPENLPLIRANLQRHDVPSVLIHTMVGERDGERIVRYSHVSGGYGLDRKTGKHHRTVSVRAMASVLDEAGVADGAIDIVKCDCEGGEMGFTTCPPELLRQVPSYVMETHSVAIARDVVKTFRDAGFRETRIKEGGNALRPFYKFEKEN